LWDVLQQYLLTIVSKIELDQLEVVAEAEKFPDLSKGVVHIFKEAIPVKTELKITLS